MPSAMLNAVLDEQEAEELRGGDAHFASTLARGLSVLTAFRAGETALGNAELARRTGLSRPTIARLTATLVQLGFLHRQPDGSGYRLGARLLTLVHPLLARLKLRQAARPIMQELADYARGAVSIAVMEGLDAVHVETVLSPDPHPLTPDIGTTTPLLQTAAGRALLALLDAPSLGVALGAFAAQRPALWAEFQATAAQEIERVRIQGFALSLGDYRPEVHGVAVPLARTESGECLSLNCGVPLYRLRPGALETEIAPRAVAAAHAIRALMLGPG